MELLITINICEVTLDPTSVAKRDTPANVRNFLPRESLSFGVEVLPSFKTTNDTLYRASFTPAAFGFKNGSKLRRSKVDAITTVDAWRQQWSASIGKVSSMNRYQTFLPRFRA
jgi:hypothetical protein